MNNTNSFLSLSLSLAAFSGLAGDLLVDGDLNVTSNLTSRSLSVTNEAVLSGPLTVSGKRVLVGANATTSNDNTFVWSDGTVIGNTTSNEFSAFASNGFRLLGGPIKGNGAGLTGLVVSNYVAGSIGSAALASYSITSTKLATGSVGTTALSNYSVTSTKLATGSVGTTALSNYSVTATKLAAGSVGTAALATNSVTAAILAAGSVGTNKATVAEWNAWGDNRYMSLSGAQDLVMNPGRTVAGYGLNVANISNGVYGASQQGKNESGSFIFQTIRTGAHGSSQQGYNAGQQIIGAGACGASQRGSNFGSQYIGPNAHGASQLGYADFCATAATNTGVGSIQLLKLIYNQTALMTGSASIGLGACTVTNDQAIVAGDGLFSHGNGTVTAVKFYGDGSGLTNLPISESVLTQAGGTLTGNLNMNGNRVTDIPAPQNEGDAVSKNYLRLVLSNLPPQGNLSMGTYTNGAPGSFPLEF